MAEELKVAESDDEEEMEEVYKSIYEESPGFIKYYYN